MTGWGYIYFSFLKKKKSLETSLVVQLLILCNSSTWSMGSIPGQGTKIPRTVLHGQKVKIKSLYCCYYSEEIALHIEFSTNDVASAGFSLWNGSFLPPTPSGITDGCVKECGSFWVLAMYPPLVPHFHSQSGPLSPLLHCTGKISGTSGQHSWRPWRAQRKCGGDRR